MNNNNSHKTKLTNQIQKSNSFQLIKHSPLDINNYELDYCQTQNPEKLNYHNNKSNFESDQCSEDQNSPRYQQSILLSYAITKLSSQSDSRYKSKIKKICIIGIIVAILTMIYMMLQILLGNSYKKKTYFLVIMLSVAQIFAYSILLYKKTKKPTLDALKIVYRTCFDFIMVFLLISLLFTVANLAFSRLWYLVMSEIFNSIPIFFVRVIVHVCLRPKQSQR